MNVILLESINGLGRSGDVVSIKNAGYARNYLVPKGYAMFATAENLKVLEERKAELQAKEAAQRKEAEALKAILETLTLEIKAETNEEGELFGSVGVSEVAKALEAQGHVISKRDIILPQGTITGLGDFPVDIICHLDVVANLNIKVM